MRLSDVEIMTWREFVIKSIGYHRERKRQKDEMQYIAWRVTIAPHLDPKHLPKTFGQFTGEKQVPKVSKEMEDQFRKAMEEFNELQKNAPAN